MLATFCLSSVPPSLFEFSWWIVISSSATLGDVLFTRCSGSGLRVNLQPTHLVGELAAELGSYRATESALAVGSVQHLGGCHDRLMRLRGTAIMQGDILPFGLRRNPVWRDSSNVKRERAVRDGYGIERMGSDSGILLGIILYFSHFLSVFLLLLCFVNV